MRPRDFHAGFTLVELVMTMVVMGILAFVAIPRFGNLKDYDETAFHDEVAAALQHGRRMAMASRRFTCVNVNAGIVDLRRDTTAPESVTSVGCTGSGGVALALPAPGKGCTATNQVCAPAGVTLATANLSGTSLIFDPLGRLVNTSKAVLGQTPTLTVSNQTAIAVSPETGYVQ